MFCVRFFLLFDTEQIPVEQAVRPPIHQPIRRHWNAISNENHSPHQLICYSMLTMKNHGHAKCANVNISGKIVWIVTLKMNVANRRNSSANECAAIKQISTVTWSVTWTQIANRDFCNKVKWMNWAQYPA